MSVNTMSVEDARVLLNSLHNQVTGQSALTPTSTADFVSQAQATLAAGTDVVFGALMQMVGATVFAVRPYSAKFQGLKADLPRWGGIIRKVSFGDKAVPADEAYHGLVDGVSVDPWKISKPQVLETRYYGSDVFQDDYTVFEQQLKNAFENEAEFGSFIAALTTHYSNVWEQYQEDMARMLLASAIAAKKATGHNVETLLTDYNGETGQSITAQDAVIDKDFWRWVRAKINTIARRFTARSGEYQEQIAGYAINRHTPVEDQRIYLLSDVLDKVNTIVNATTYHDEPLQYADVEGVDFWQSIQNPDEIQMTPTYIDSTGAVVTASAQTLTDVFGIIFDKDAMMYSVIDFSVMNSPMNQKGRYFNVNLTANIRYCLDMTEKIDVLLLQ